MITFELWTEPGGCNCGRFPCTQRRATGSVTVPAPRRWYRRILLRFAAYLFRTIAAAEERAD